MSFLTVNASHSITIKRTAWGLMALASLVLLAGCNPIDDAEEDNNLAPTTSLKIQSIKLFHFQWPIDPNATHYLILENPDGIKGFSEVSSEIAPDTNEFDLEVPLYARLNAEYIVQTCIDKVCSNSRTLTVSGNLSNAIGYVKSSNTTKNDDFGEQVALDQSGDTLAVGAPGADTVYVFTRNDIGAWEQQQSIQGNHTEEGDLFGISVSLSADGNLLAVGALFEDSNAIGVNGNQTNNDALGSGAAYVFSRTGTFWVQEAYLKAFNTGSQDRFGTSVSLSGNGDRLAVGAMGEASKKDGVNTSNGNNNEANEAGAVYVFLFNDSESKWEQEAYIKASNSGQGDYFGKNVSLSANGTRLAVSADSEDSDTKGINGNDNDDADDSGAVYMFNHSAALGWVQNAYIKASNTDKDDGFGVSISLSANGNRLAVGAKHEDSEDTGVDNGVNNGNQGNNTETRSSGAVYVFHYKNSNWEQEAYLKASNAQVFDFFGASVSLSADGTLLAVGADGEDSNARGVKGDEANNDAGGSGAVYVFQNDGTAWAQKAYVKALNIDEDDDGFGRSLSLSGDGQTLAVGAKDEDSNATGIQGDPTDNSQSDSGAVFLF